MTLKRIDDEKPPCLDPSHDPPSHMALQPGTYEWTCPACGHVTRFEVVLNMASCSYELRQRMLERDKSGKFYAAEEVVIAVKALDADGKQRRSNR